ncbi:MFS transporter [Paenalcaligenes niemegkensis]|uniref:MFS transporter n=1 Tax=Paenalcaligenes niemegkensis TaxID=2895469 RepID=UPI0027E2A09A|nr:MFS transporter [Paenalcaligenes niemegkensis]
MGTAHQEKSGVLITFVLPIETAISPDDEDNVKKATLPDGLPKPQRIRAAATLLLAIAITVLDATMSNVALPTIALELDIEASQVVWVSIAYSLTVVMTLLPLSAVADRVGLRRLFVLGTVVFLVASLGAAYAQSFTTLLCARIAQGLGSSMLMCLFGGLVRNIYPAKRLAMGLSLNAMVVAMTAVMGPSIGAFILSVASWRWIFLITVPLCALTWLGIRYLPEAPRTRKAFDWIACLLSAPVFGLSILGLDLLTSQPLWAAACLIVAALCARYLIARSLTQDAPIVPVDLLKITAVGYAVLASLFSFASQMAAMIALPFYFRQVLHYSYADIGVFLGAWSIGVAIMAPVSAYLSARLPVATLCAVGAGATAAGMTGLLMLGTQGSYILVISTMLVSGVGFGFFQTPNNRALLAGVPRHRSGAAGGMQATTRVFGQSFGTALVALVFGASVSNGPF